MDNVLRQDIFVVGGGTAGCAAAIAAARRGHSVLLAEENNCLGGVSTAGGVSEWFANIEGLGDIFDQVHTEIEKFGAVFGRYYNGEYLKLVWQILAARAGVDVLLNTTLLSAARDGPRVASVQLLSCSQQIAIEASYFIDTSGEGDLAFLAGAEFFKGDPQTGHTLHMSLTCILYDTAQPVKPYLPPDIVPIQSDEELPGLGTGVPLPDGRVYCNATKIMGHDPTDPFSLSKAEQEARIQLMRVLHYLQRTKYPTHVLGSTGSRIGIREGRRIIGDYVLTEEDIIQDERHKRFPDGVTVATSQIDFHSLTRPGSIGWRQAVLPYNIPFRCLIVKGLANLLMAGKCISGDQVAQSSYRMTPTCCGMGQAAGTAAALALEHGVEDIRDIRVTQLRAELAASGVELDPARHKPFATVSEEEISDKSSSL
jgi:hypothetical protein